jgi:hypothetical protein
MQHLAQVMLGKLAGYHNGPACGNGVSEALCEGWDVVTGGCGLWMNGRHAGWLHRLRCHRRRAGNGLIHEALDGAQ